MEISDQIISVLDALSEKLGIAVDWSQQNIVPYLQNLMDKYIAYEIATSVVYIAVFAIIPFPLYKLGMFFHKKVIDRGGYDDCDSLSWVAVVAWVVFAGFTIAAIAVIFSRVLDIITCVTFPEKIILEYIKTTG